MVMWNLVGHGVKWAARGIEAFSKSGAGKRTAEVSARALQAARDASRDAITTYKQLRSNRSENSGGASLGARWTEGTTVVASDGRVGVVVRYLTAAEVGGSVTDKSLTSLVLLDLLQHTSELDRYLIASENSIRGV